ncbi:hypothetical protein B0H19DRAFT_1082813 [Mycena capillaripes]|nr:hypothetical protein B0H19DRAFT_1082813 [Mycena capillaripes]
MVALARYGYWNIGGNSLRGRACMPARRLYGSPSHYFNTKWHFLIETSGQRTVVTESTDGRYGYGPVRETLEGLATTGRVDPVDGAPVPVRLRVQRAAYSGQFGEPKQPVVSSASRTLDNALTTPQWQRDRAKVGNFLVMDGSSKQTRFESGLVRGIEKLNSTTQGTPHFSQATPARKSHLCAAVARSQLLGGSIPLVLRFPHSQVVLLPIKYNLPPRDPPPPSPHIRNFNANPPWSKLNPICVSWTKAGLAESGAWALSADKLVGTGQSIHIVSANINLSRSILEDWCRRIGPKPNWLPKYTLGPDHLSNAKPSSGCARCPPKPRLEDVAYSPSPPASLGHKTAVPLSVDRTDTVPPAPHQIFANIKKPPLNQLNFTPTPRPMFLLYHYVKERRKEKKAERSNHESAAKNAAAPIEPFMMPDSPQTLAAAQASSPARSAPNNGVHGHTKCGENRPRN